MIKTLSRIMVAALLVAAVVSFPKSASAFSYFAPAQTQSVYSNTWTGVAVFDPYGYQLYNTDIIYGSYDYTFYHPYADTVYDHWIYDFDYGQWVSRLGTDISLYY